MNGFEDVGGQLVGNAERIERMIKLLVRHKRFIKGQRHALKNDIWTVLFNPFWQHRLKMFTMRATVHEKFKNFDFAR